MGVKIKKAKSPKDTAEGIKAEHLGKREQVFTHIDNETGEVRHFAATRLMRYVKARKLETVLAPMDREHAEFIAKHRGVERKRINWLMKPENLATMKEPILFCKMPGGTHLIVDGQHRYLVYAHLEIENVRAIIVEENIWKRFLVIFPAAQAHHTENVRAVLNAGREHPTDPDAHADA